MTRRHLLLGAAFAALKNGGLHEAFTLLDRAAKSGEAAASAILVRQGETTVSKSFGKADTPRAVFLLASITKPMTATAVMLLKDRGELRLDDAVQRFIPEFRGDGRDRVCIRHLLNHTSGLPDMLPSNEELRKRHAPLSDFVAGTCRTPLLFKPGTEVRYQSMGILLAAEIAVRITRQPFPNFLAENVFRPLKMSNTTLGLGRRAKSDTMQCQVEQVSDWDWNSDYWRNLGAPWGGAHSTVEDVGHFLRYFADPSGIVLKPETARSMVTNQTPGMKETRGFGWKVEPPARWGHSGSTGTDCWHDSGRDLTYVLLTTRPAAQSQRTLLNPVSKLVAKAA